MFSEARYIGQHLDLIELVKAHGGNKEDLDNVILIERIYLTKNGKKQT